MAQEGGTVITGKRFEGHVSPSRTLADIVDQRLRGRLILLKKDDAIELRDLCQELIESMGGE
jgi:hypothetical protein